MCGSSDRGALEMPDHPDNESAGSFVGHAMAGGRCVAFVKSCSCRLEVMPVRRVWAGACLVLMVAACSGGEMSLTEYVGASHRRHGSGNPAMGGARASRQGAIFADGAQLTDFAPQDLQAGLERMGEIQVELWEDAAAIEPPDEVTDLHNLLFDARFTSAREALAARAGTASSWEELSESPEMAAYRTSVAADKQAGVDIQAELDATGRAGDLRRNAVDSE